jgi:2-methylisocitrate lyase-like PEP mutase family enzyme
MSAPAPAILAERAARLRALHVPGTPLLLANAWDVASARVIAAANFPAIATTSGGVAAALGYRDGENIPAEMMFAAVARMAVAVDVPVSADLEGGYGLEPDDLVERLLRSGAVGLNIEDTDHAVGGTTLVDADVQAGRLAAIKEAASRAGVPVVLNARIDVFVRGGAAPPDTLLEEGLRRARRYAAAGADCVYPIMLADEGAIARFSAESSVAVNIYLRPGAPSAARLAELGVARISTGTALHRATMHWLEQTVAALRAAPPVSR